MNKNLPCVLKVENGVPNPMMHFEYSVKSLSDPVSGIREFLRWTRVIHCILISGLGLSDMDEWTGANHILDDLGVKTSF